MRRITRIKLLNAKGIFYAVMQVPVTKRDWTGEC